MIEVGIIGASGYTGGELLRIISRHSSFRAVWATSRQYAGKAVEEVFPYLRDFTSLVLSAPGLDRIPEGIKAVLVALPHTEAMEVVPSLLEKGIKVVDLSADYRLADPAVYGRWYGHQHTSPALLEEAVYGLPEIHRERISSARLVANPGCYPTAVILALAPLAKRGLIGESGVVVDAKSGVSGAGRSLKVDSLFCEAHEGLTPYLAGRHRHIPEMEQELKGVSGTSVRLTFTPHLVPMNRGLLATTYLEVSAGAGLNEIEKAFGEDYKGEPFVKVAPVGILPAVQEVTGTNLCRIGFTDDPRGKRLILVSVIDNLIKGASGQAVHNLNLMFGLPETSGLEGPGLFP